MSPSERLTPPSVSALPHWWVRMLHTQIRGRTDLLTADATIVATAGLAGAVLGAVQGQLREAAGQIVSHATPDCIALAEDASPDAPGSALAHIRQEGGVVLPIGAAARPVIRIGGRAWPLPGARLVVVVDPPVHLPAGSGSALADWQRTLIALLRRADGLAADRLATWGGSRTRTES